MNKKISALATAITLIASAASAMPVAPSVNAAEADAKSVDLSTDIFLPEVFNQNPLGSCVACATTYYQFTYEARKAVYYNYLEKHKNDPDQDKVKEKAKELISFTYSPAAMYSQINGGKDGGSREYLAYILLKNRGALNLDNYKYDHHIGISFNEDHNPYEAFYINHDYYDSLDKSEQEFFEEVNEKYYRRIGEYITPSEYDALSEEDKKKYLPVLHDDLYYRYVKPYRVIPRDEKLLFDALKLRLDSFEGCSVKYSKILDKMLNPL